MEEFSKFHVLYAIFLCFSQNNLLLVVTLGKSNSKFMNWKINGNTCFIGLKIYLLTFRFDLYYVMNDLTIKTGSLSHCIGFISDS